MPRSTRAILATLGLALVSVLRAAEPALPSFDSKSIGLPPLSLAEIARGALAPRAHDLALSPPRISLPVAPRKAQSTSAMPVIEPNPAINYSMIVKAPDPTTDYKLRVLPPAVEAAK